MSTSTELRWDAPGAGDWWLVREHCAYSVSRMFASLFPAATVGWNDGAARYGLPTGVAQWAAVNGWMYFGPQIPPTPDELDRREVAAEATLLTSPWRVEVRRWYDEERPGLVGVPDVFDRIHDGDIVEVDAPAGAVRVVGRGS